MFRRFVLGAVAALALAGGAQAQEKLRLDRSHMHIGFQVTHIGFSITHGTFNDAAGELTFDPADPAKSTLRVTIQTKSVDTNHQARDAHLRNADFLDVEKHPTMTFVATRIERTGENTGRMTGDLTLLGTTRPATFDVRFFRMAEHPFPDYKKVLTAGFSARGKIKRSEFGMTKFVGPISDEVEIAIDVEFVKCEGEAAEAPSCKS